LNSAKAADQQVSQLRGWAEQTCMCPGNHVLDGGPDLTHKVALLRGHAGTIPGILPGSILKETRKVAAHGDVACCPPLLWQLVLLEAVSEL